MPPYKIGFRVASMQGRRGLLPIFVQDRVQGFFNAGQVRVLAAFVQDRSFLSIAQMQRGEMAGAVLLGRNFIDIG